MRNSLFFGIGSAISIFISSCSPSPNTQSETGIPAAPSDPPAFLTQLYGTDFTYVEYDSLQLEALPVVDVPMELFISEEEFTNQGITSINRITPVVSGKKWLFRDNSNFPGILVRENGLFELTLLGTEGKGPGEYGRNIAVNYRVENDAIWVATQLRLMKYSPDGNFLDQKTTKAFSSNEISEKFIVEHNPFNSEYIFHIYERSKIEQGILDDPIECLPQIDQKHPRMQIPTAHASWYSDNHILIRYPRFPFLMYAQADETGKCSITSVINLNKKHTQGTTVVETKLSESAYSLTYHSPIDIEFSLQNCIIVGDFSRPQFLQVCNGVPQRWLRFPVAGSDPLIFGRYYAGADEDYLYLRSNISSGYDVYQTKIPDF